MTNTTGVTSDTMSQYNGSLFYQVWGNQYLRNDVLKRLKTRVNFDVIDMDKGFGHRYKKIRDTKMRVYRSRSTAGIDRDKVMYFDDIMMTADWISKNKYFYLMYDKLMHSKTVFHLSFASVARLLIHNKDYAMFQRFYEAVPDMFYHTNRNRFYGKERSKSEDERDFLRRCNKSKKSRLKYHAGVKETIVDLACKGGSTRIVEFLVGQGYFATERGLLYAVEKGHLEVVRYIVRYCKSIKATSEAMDLAIKHGFKEIVVYLAENGVGYSAKSLRYPSEKNDGDLLEILYGLDSSKFVDNANLLLGAAKGGHLGLVQLLINEGTISKKKVMESDVMSFALSSGNKELVEYLESTFAELTIASRCLEFIASNGHLEMFVKYHKLVQRDGYRTGGYNMYYALKNRHYNILEYLIKNSLGTFDYSYRTETLLAKRAKELYSSTSLRVADILKVLLVYPGFSSSIGRIATAMSDTLGLTGVFDYFVNSSNYNYRLGELFFYNLLKGDLEKCKVIIGSFKADLLQNYEHWVELNCFESVQWLYNTFEQDLTTPKSFRYQIHNCQFKLNVVVSLDFDKQKSIQQFYYCTAKKIPLNQVQYFVFALQHGYFDIIDTLYHTQDINNLHKKNRFPKYLYERTIAAHYGVEFKPRPDILQKSPYILNYYLYLNGLTSREDFVMDKFGQIKKLKFLYYNFNNQLPYTQNIYLHAHTSRFNKQLVDFIYYNMIDRVSLTFFLNNYRIFVVRPKKYFVKINFYGEKNPKERVIYFVNQLESEPNKNLNYLMCLKRMFDKIIKIDYPSILGPYPLSLIKKYWNSFGPKENDLLWNYLSPKVASIGMSCCFLCKIAFPPFVFHQCRHPEGGLRLVGFACQLILDCFGSHKNGHNSNQEIIKVFPKGICGCTRLLLVNSSVSFGPNNSLELLIDTNFSSPVIVFKDKIKKSIYLLSLETSNNNNNINMNEDLKNKYPSSFIYTLNFGKYNLNVHLPRLPYLSIYAISLISSFKAYIYNE
ncbi:hypothetical protein CYY_002348 [Polysphondylium violaceum]|uniref:Ankyrin repeat-containing protein n=1 Tax=Polysphondylium violaceum TaxID=133409 RepID=A0A8J4Q0B8_9MYCE|nr:hypothetical protein CYY_002348 [Polysphondylium violaceum]